MKKYVLGALALLSVSSAFASNADLAFGTGPWTPVDGTDGIYCIRDKYDSDKIEDQELRLVARSWEYRPDYFNYPGFPTLIEITSHQHGRENIMGSGIVELDGRNKKGEVRYEMYSASTQYTVGILYCRSMK